MGMESGKAVLIALKFHSTKLRIVKCAHRRNQQTCPAFDSVWAMECVRVRFGEKRRHPSVPALQGSDEGDRQDRSCPKRAGTDRV
jgi:hypothetical protein